MAKPCEIINRYDKPSIDKICELGNVLVSAAFMFQSMPREPDGSHDEEEEPVRVSLSLSVFSDYVHTHRFRVMMIFHRPRNLSTIFRRKNRKVFPFD